MQGQWQRRRGGELGHVRGPSPSVRRTLPSPLPMLLLLFVLFLLLFLYTSRTDRSDWAMHAFYV